MRSSGSRRHARPSLGPRPPCRAPCLLVRLPPPRHTGSPRPVTAQGFTLALGALVVGLSILAGYTHLSVIPLALLVNALLGGPIFAVFLLGIFTRRTNAPGALCGIAAGLAFTLYVATAKFGCGSPPLLPQAACDGPLAPALALNNFAMTIYIGGLAAAVAYAASHVVGAPPELAAEDQLTYYDSKARAR